MSAFESSFRRHDVMGEEGTRIETGSEYKWYVDPLDGTTNFAHGYPVFCVSLAVEFRGQRVAAVIYDPTRDEMFTASNWKRRAAEWRADPRFRDCKSGRVL